VSSIEDGVGTAPAPTANGSSAASSVGATPQRPGGAAPSRKPSLRWGPGAAAATSDFEAHFSANAATYGSVAEFDAALGQVGFAQSQVIFGIDCTKSNLWNGGESFSGRSLHDLTPDLPPNPYVTVIRALSTELARFDKDGKIPVYAFGDKSSSDRSVFPFHTKPEGCDGFDDVLRAYAARIPTVTLAGPTSFGPIIRKAVEHVKQDKSGFTILVILADGQVTAVRDTEQALVHASHVPLSIVCVGVGDGPWEAMRVLDSGLPKRRFDNFKFVELNAITASLLRDSAAGGGGGKGVEGAGRSLSDAIVCAALSEVPAQYRECKRLGLL
jgi:E3 ubiquitin-protein ligase RGLG